MSEHAAADHGHDQAITDEHFGAATDGKIGMWIFLLTDAFSFSGLLLAYGILRAGAAHWPTTGEDGHVRLGIPFTAFMTFILICSSVTMVLALNAAQNRNKRGLLGWLPGTIAGGA